MASLALADLTGRLNAAFRVSREPFWALMSQALTSAANFATTVILIRATGLTEFGRFSIAFIVLMISRNLLNGTVLMPMSAIAPKLRGKSIPAYRGFLLANGAGFGATASLLMYFGASVLGWAIGAAWLPELAGGLALANFAANAADVFRRYQFVKASAFQALMIDVTRFAVQLGLLLGAALWVPSLLDANIALFMLAAGSGAAAIFGMALFGRAVWRRRLSAAVWPRHLHFIRWMAPGIALRALQMQAPIFLGAAMLGEAVVGGVRALQQTINLMNLPLNSLDNVLPSIGARTFARSGESALRRLLNRTLVASAAFLGVTSATLLVVWPLVSPFLKVENFGLAMVVPLLLAAFANLLSFVSTVKLIAVERPNLITRSYAACAVLTLPLTLLLIDQLDTMGVVLSVLASATALQFILLNISWRCYGAK